jgi:nucleoid DNA-binding protein
MSNVITGDFDRSELITLTAAETNETRDTVEEVLKSALRILATQIAQRGYVTLRDFGSFRVDELAARSGTDPQGNHYDAPARLTIQFNPEKRFRDELSELTGKVVIA